MISSNNFSIVSWCRHVKGVITLNFTVFVFAAVILLIAFMFFEQYLKKRFSIQKREGWIYRPVNRLQKYGEIFLLIVTIVSFFWFNDQTTLMLLIYLILSNCFRTIMEWLYRRKTGRFWLDLSATVFCILLLILGIACHITA